VNHRQLAFDLNHRPALGEEDFLVAPCNAEAVGWIDRFPKWPSHALIISGPPGSGKTHLSRVFMAKAKAVELPATSLLDDAIPVLPDAAAVVIEDADMLAGHAVAEEALFHLYNQAKSSGSSLLFTAGSPASRWEIKLADLSSRLRSLPSVEISEPDDTLITTILVKLFADRQIAIDDTVLQYVVPRIERTFSAIQKFVAAADKKALEDKRKITVPLARAVLQPDQRLPFPD
jgi:DnaA regulatory inactivator Hda